MTRRTAIAQTIFPLLAACGGGGTDTPPPDAGQVLIPTIVKQPSSLTILAGGTAVFGVEAKGSSVKLSTVTADGLSYQWLRNGIELTGATSAVLQSGHSSILDTGAQFSVRVHGPSGSVLSEVATLTVVSPSLTVIAGRTDAYGYVDGPRAAALFEDPRPIAIDDAGNVYLGARAPTAHSTGARHTIRKVAIDGTVTTFAGLKGQDGLVDGTGSMARFHEIIALGFDRARNRLMVVDSTPSSLQPVLREVTLDAVVTTRHALNMPRAFNAAFGPDGSIYLASGTYVGPGGLGVPNSIPTAIYKAGSGGAVALLAGSPDSQGTDDGTGSAARFLSLRGLAVGAAGTAYVADGFRIRKVAADGAVTTLAGSAESSMIQPMNPLDGIGPIARFVYPGALAVDAKGLLVCDGAFIRHVTPDGHVSTFAELPQTVFHAGQHLGGTVLDDSGKVIVATHSWVGRFSAFGG
jgi:hypothetical protein